MPRPTGVDARCLGLGGTGATDRCRSRTTTRSGRGGFPWTCDVGPLFGPTVVPVPPSLWHFPLAGEGRRLARPLDIRRGDQNLTNPRVEVVRGRELSQTWAKRGCEGEVRSGRGPGGRGARADDGPAYGLGGGPPLVYDLSDRGGSSGAPSGRCSGSWGCRYPRRPPRSAFGPSQGS